MPDLDGIAWREERQADIDAGLDWLEELHEATARIIAEEDERYRHLPWPRPSVEDEARILEPFDPEIEEAA